MINFLKGVIEEVGENFATIDVNGVGYHFFASSKMLSSITEGEVTKIHIYPYIKEDQFTLFGFEGTPQRKLFETLITVNGVGVKMALSVMSTLTEDEISSAIVGADVAMLTRASGVGKKLAERIVLELKGKITALPTSSGAQIKYSNSGVVDDVVSALANLGYKPSQTRGVINVAVGSVGAGAEFEDLFKAALNQLKA